MSRRAVFFGAGQIEVEQAPDPIPAPHEVIVEVAACGICGTDRAIFRGDYPVRAPIVLGHEYAGTVLATGSDVSTVEVGQTVCIDPNVTCRQCTFCRRGLSHLCQNLTPLGITLSGGFAERSAVPVGNIYRVPESLAVEAAALIEPLACSLRGLQQAHIQQGDIVVILGAGAIGCLLLQLSTLAGSAVNIVAEPELQRRARAKRFGADYATDIGDELEGVLEELTEGVGADVVIEASGTLEGARQTLDLVRRGGHVVWFGVYPESGRLAISPFLVNENEITIRGSFNNPFTHQAAVALAGSGRIKLDQLISDRIRLDQLQGFLEPGGEPPAGKAIVLPHVTDG
jgi:2-desacetyl-2-hydroxyethyl bacteriochlorophyllide A dehydrogenase